MLQEFFACIFIFGLPIQQKTICLFAVGIFKDLILKFQTLCVCVCCHGDVNNPYKFPNQWECFEYAAVLF